MTDLDSGEAIARARLALEGLSVGDAFGEQFLHVGLGLRARVTTPPFAHEQRWPWTDDTAMALAVVEQLAAHGAIDPTALAAGFARRYREDPARGYGAGARTVLAKLVAGEPHLTAARALFGGTGSYGNGAAMRAAPIGAYFAGDDERVIASAIASAEPTHAHPDGVAGAVAVALAAAAVFAGERDPHAIVERTALRTPAGPTRDNLRRALAMRDADHITVASELGNGSRAMAADTVPFAVWCAATHVGDYAAALAACTEIGGDLDTICAIVGGIIVGAVGLAGIPAGWRAARAELPVV